MLAFARRQDLDAKPVDPSALVRGMMELLQRTLGPSIEIETKFPRDLRSAITDLNQLELAVLNLAVNARDSMPDGGKITFAAREERVDLRHDTRLEVGDYICLSVTDSGDGMDADTLARATEPFFTTKGVGKGTGLGLSMVHGMAEQMGGRLMIHSRKGAGTTAEIWLPAAASGGATPTVTDKTPNSAGDKQRTLRVLAVDDDALVLFNTTAMLEEMGHTVIEAYSGDAALTVLREQKIDLVITDQAMPKMTGMQLIETIRAQWPDLPVILATGYAELPGGVKVDVPKISKPFSERELAAALAGVRIIEGA